MQERPGRLLLVLGRNRGLYVLTWFSDDKLWKCCNVAFFVATGFRVLCLDTVVTVGFVSRQDLVLAGGS